MCVLIIWRDSRGCDVLRRFLFIEVFEGCPRFHFNVLAIY